MGNAGIMDIYKRGRLAEELVYLLFKESGIEIYPNGIEKIHPEFYLNLNKKKSIVGGQVKRLISNPDFIVGDCNDEYKYVEVKFRTISHFPIAVTEGDLMKNDYIKLRDVFFKAQLWWRPKIIMVTDEPIEMAGFGSGIFTVFSPPYYQKRKMYFDDISCIKKWNIDKAVLKKYEDLVLKIFKCKKTETEKTEAAAIIRNLCPELEFSEEDL